MTCSTSRAGSSARPARPIASTAARCAPATCRLCSQMRQPAPAHRRWCTRAGAANDLALRGVAGRTREQAEAARLQALRAADLPALRDNEARAAAGLQRLTNAREMLDREEARARERRGELDRRLSQFTADI